MWLFHLPLMLRFHLPLILPFHLPLNATVTFFRLYCNKNINDLNNLWRQILNATRIHVSWWCKVGASSDVYDGAKWVRHRTFMMVQKSGCAIGRLWWCKVCASSDVYDGEKWVRHRTFTIMQSGCVVGRLWWCKVGASSDVYDGEKWVHHRSFMMVQSGCVIGRLCRGLNWDAITYTGLTPINYILQF